MLATTPICGLCNLWADLAPAEQTTHLIELTQGSHLSSLVGGFRRQGYESAQGAWIGLERWYGTRLVDVRATFLTQLSPTTGVIWGISTGEYGRKYSIEPSIKLGFLWRYPVGSGWLALRATTILAGRLRERACIADYGDIGGGIQSVNCRLAATPLPPEETLSHLLRMRPPDRHEWQLRYVLPF